MKNDKCFLCSVWLGSVWISDTAEGIVLTSFLTLENKATCSQVTAAFSKINLTLIFIIKVFYYKQNFPTYLS